MGHFLDQLVGSMSEGADGNPTVAMVEAAFAHHGLPWRYVNMEVPPAGLAAAVAGARAMGFRGFNCSVPHKIAVIDHLDSLGRSAALIGAVNTVVRHPGPAGADVFVGENTDGRGFVASLADLVPPAGVHVAILGAGGAARAIAVELALAGAGRLTIANRTVERAADLADTIRSATPSAVDVVRFEAGWAVPDDVHVLVNGTSIGLYAPDEMPPIDPGSLRPDLIVADVVFSPVDTRLLRTAAAAGCRTLGGLGMLVNQGAEAIRLWTGVDTNRAVLRTALEQALAVA